MIIGSELLAEWTRNKAQSFDAFGYTLGQQAGPRRRGFDTVRLYQLLTRDRADVALLPYEDASGQEWGFVVTVD